MISSTCAITARCCCNSRVGVRLIASFVILPSSTAACRGPKPLSKCWPNSLCCTTWGGAARLFLVDDNFIGNRRDALRLLRALIPWQRERHYPFNLCTEASMNLVEYDELMEAMIQAGFTSVFVGIETPTPAALIATKKKQNVRKDDPEYPLHAVHTLQEKGFEVMGGFILGLDGETPEVFDLHIRFIQQAAIAMAMEGLLTVLKGTDLYYRMEREGRLRGDTTGNNLDTQLNFVPEMPEEVLNAGYKRVLNTIYDRRLATVLCPLLDPGATPGSEPSPHAHVDPVAPARDAALCRGQSAATRVPTRPRLPAVSQPRHHASSRHAPGSVRPGCERLPPEKNHRADHGRG